MWPLLSWTTKRWECHKDPNSYFQVGSDGDGGDYDGDEYDDNYGSYS